MSSYAYIRQQDLVKIRTSCGLMHHGVEGKAGKFGLARIVALCAD